MSRASSSVVRNDLEHIEPGAALSPESGASSCFKPVDAVALTDIAYPSPARALQEQLAAALEAPPASDGKWPPIATLGFIVGTCGPFWAGVAYLLLRH